MSAVRVLPRCVMPFSCGMMQTKCKQDTASLVARCLHNGLPMHTYYDHQTTLSLTRYDTVTSHILTPCVPPVAKMHARLSSLAWEGQPTFCIYASHIHKAAGEGTLSPSNPKHPKALKGNLWRANHEESKDCS